jgi:hypothetical protein
MYCRSHYHSRPHRYTQFLQLAISLVIDLRLDRPPQTRIWKTVLRFDPQESSQEQTLDRLSLGSDEQRAVLGCYYLSSSYVFDPSEALEFCLIFGSG